LIETDVAPVVAQVSVTLPPPEGRFDGVALKESQASAGGATVTGALHVTVPAAPVTVRTNVRELGTFTVVEPSTATAPMPWLIEAEVAPVDAHVRVTLPPPTGRFDGVAEKASQEIGCTLATVTGALHVTVPAAPVAVRTKVRELVTLLTTTEPSTGCAPTPSLIETDVAPVVAHVRVTLPPPAGRFVGVAEKASQEIGCTLATVTGA